MVEVERELTVQSPSELPGRSFIEVFIMVEDLLIFQGKTGPVGKYKVQVALIVENVTFIYLQEK